MTPMEEELAKHGEVCTAVDQVYRKWLMRLTKSIEADRVAIEAAPDRPAIGLPKDHLVRCQKCGLEAVVGLRGPLPDGERILCVCGGELHWIEGVPRLTPQEQVDISEAVLRAYRKLREREADAPTVVLDTPPVDGGTTDVETR